MMPAMRKAEPKRTKIITRSVLLDKDTDTKLLAIAQREERPLTWVIAKACKEYVERHENPTT